MGSIRQASDTFTAPNGAIHHLDDDGACDTCPVDHLGLHGRHVRRFLAGEPCTVTAAPGAYPYACRLSRRRPDAVVSICTTHDVWWVDEEPSHTLV